MANTLIPGTIAHPAEGADLATNELNPVAPPVSAVWAVQKETASTIITAPDGQTLCFDWAHVDVANVRRQITELHQDTLDVHIGVEDPHDIVVMGVGAALQPSAAQLDAPIEFIDERYVIEIVEANDPTTAGEPDPAREARRSNAWMERAAQLKGPTRWYGKLDDNVIRLRAEFEEDPSRPPNAGAILDEWQTVALRVGDSLKEYENALEGYAFTGGVERLAAAAITTA